MILSEEDINLLTIFVAVRFCVGRLPNSSLPCQKQTAHILKSNVN